MSFYGNVVDGQAYWSQAGYSGTLTEANLLAASRYIDALGWRVQPTTGLPVSLFPGVPSVAGQLREWPREGAVDYYGNEVSGIPQAIIDATYEAAFIEASSDVDLNAPTSPNGVVTTERLGPMSVRYDSMGGGASGFDWGRGLTLYPNIQRLLAPYITSVRAYGITGRIV